ncbi:MAG: sulfatase [Verrucomicrobiales bacterium]|nr:sulfatase [Verrucomicrobiales bacterium]
MSVLTRGGAAMLRLLSLVLFAVGAGSSLGAASTEGAARPNILWLTCEDTGPHLGCYGDPDATTPRLDAFAATGMRFRRAWSTAPVCAPARTAIISGMYPSATGSEHMRSWVPMPSGTRMFPQILREQGYYCSNNSKEDYNLEGAAKVWDESSPRAHWRNRRSDQPFFAVFNFTESHESQIRKRPHAFVHDPSRVRIPPYMPDTPEAREGWAQYHDQVSVVDGRVGAVLDELKASGLEDDTIVFFFGDHGPGLPRNKRSACDSGLRVPLIVRFPERWRGLAPEGYAPGGESGRLVSFVDLAPTLLSMVGVKPPEWMHGSAWCGRFAGAAPAYVHGLRGRMDERYDLVRSVTDGRYVYVRNYLPDRPHGQHVEYMFETPMAVAWKRLFDAGRLSPVHRAYWEPRAPEELYDLESDPYETVNLAASPEHRKVLLRLRDARREHAKSFGDVDLLPEAEMLRRAAGKAPGDLTHEPRKLDVARLLDAAERAAGEDPNETARLRRMTGDREAGVRYWGAVGLRIRGTKAVAAGRGELRKLLQDESPSVRVAAAEALAAHGPGGEARDGASALLELADARRHGYWVAVAAMNAIDNLPSSARPPRSALEGLPTSAQGINARMNDYLVRLKKHLTRNEPDTTP